MQEQQGDDEEIYFVKKFDNSGELELLKQEKEWIDLVEHYKNIKKIEIIEGKKYKYPSLTEKQLRNTIFPPWHRWIMNLVGYRRSVMVNTPLTWVMQQLNLVKSQQYLKDLKE